MKSRRRPVADVLYRAPFLGGQFMKFKTLITLLLVSTPAHGAMTSALSGHSSAYVIQSSLASQRVVFSGAAGHSPHYRDYFGLYAAGSETRLQWCYLDGTKTPDTARLLKTGACTFDGLKTGDYAVRIYAAGGTATLIDSVLFTVDPPIQEYRYVSQDAALTIERTKQSATTDKVVIKRSGNGNVETFLIPAEIVIKQSLVSYAAPSVVPTLAAKKAQPAVKAAPNP
jgi:hypothetical protein